MIQVVTVIECTANRGLISKISWPTRAKEVIWVKKLIHEALLWKALHRQWERFLFDTIRKKKKDFYSINQHMEGQGVHFLRLDCEV